MNWNFHNILLTCIGRFVGIFELIHIYLGIVKSFQTLHDHMIISGKYGYKTGRYKVINWEIDMKWIWPWSISQRELLHWGTGRYLINWIQVVQVKFALRFAFIQRFGGREVKNELFFFGFSNGKYRSNLFQFENNLNSVHNVPER